MGQGTQKINDQINRNLGGNGSGNWRNVRRASGNGSKMIGLFGTIAAGVAIIIATVDDLFGKPVASQKDITVYNKTKGR